MKLKMPEILISPEILKIMTRSYIPKRNHIVYLDFDPTKGKEVGKYRLALILSSEEYNKNTGLVSRSIN